MLVILAGDDLLVVSLSDEVKEGAAGLQPIRLHCHNPQLHQQDDETWKMAEHPLKDSAGCKRFGTSDLLRHAVVVISRHILIYQLHLVIRLSTVVPLMQVSAAKVIIIFASIKKLLKNGGH